MVTAGNASGINDGAAAVVITSSSKARELGLTPRLKLVARAEAGVEPSLMGSGPIPAVQKALQKAGPILSDMSTDQQTTVYMMTDGAFLYVAVDAKQRIPVRATEHTNGVGLDTDDEVQVDLWPNGTSGFRYKFTSTPIGTHYQYSTENNSFELEWWTAGKIVDGGYVINMKIPLSVMHGTGSHFVSLNQRASAGDNCASIQRITRPPPDD